ncbi:MAG: FGGY family carbohydrate kinase [Anaerolineae bacterium]|nr:FGGY family carbohydrate kinase [Thermoflexales bacterium]MDW8408642.1 FGGY family carbohydrate kinase [Anaerolineae bacterium]
MTQKLLAPVVLAVDVGTTFIKAGLISPQGHVVCLSQRSTPWLNTPPPAFEIDMDALAAAALDAMQACCPAEYAPRVAAIAVTAQGDGLWPLDRDGRPAGPATTWRDGRSDPMIETWQQTGQSTAIVQLTATPPTASHQTTQLAWLSQHAPERLQAVDKLIFAEDWIGYVLTGVIGVCASGNYEHTYGRFHSLPSRVANPVADVLRILDLGWAQPWLPDPLPALEARGMLQRAIARRVGLPSGVPVFVGPFDVLTGVLGAGATQLDQAASIWGTAAIHGRWVGSFSSLNMGCLVSHPQAKGRWLRFVPTSAGMTNFNYWRDMFLHDEANAAWSEVESQAARSPHGANGLLYFPYLTSSYERSEALRVSGACFVGAHEGHQKRDYVRAIYEGLAMQAARIFKKLKQFDIPLTEVRVAGGGGQSALLSALLASAGDLRVVRPATTEASLLGAAAVALVGIGHSTSVDELAKSMAQAEQTFEPDPCLTSFYAEMAEQVETMLTCFSISRRRSSRARDDSAQPTA